MARVGARGERPLSGVAWQESGTKCRVSWNSCAFFHSTCVSNIPWIATVVQFILISLWFDTMTKERKQTINYVG